jgi:hypothetical protein
MVNAAGKAFCFRAVVVEAARGGAGAVGAPPPPRGLGSAGGGVGNPVAARAGGGAVTYRHGLGVRLRAVTSVASVTGTSVYWRSASAFARGKSERERGRRGIHDVFAEARCLRSTP